MQKVIFAEMPPASETKLTVDETSALGVYFCLQTGRNIDECRVTTADAEPLGITGSALLVASRGLAADPKTRDGALMLSGGAAKTPVENLLLDSTRRSASFQLLDPTFLLLGIALAAERCAEWKTPAEQDTCIRAHMKILIPAFPEPQTR